MYESNVILPIMGFLSSEDIEVRETHEKVFKEFS